MSTGFFVLIIIVVTVYVSYKGFTNNRFFENYEFEVDRILVDRQYKRLVTSGFLHTGWMHLGFNMFSLYIFSGVVGMGLGSLNFLIIYFASLIGGGLLSLLIHRHHGSYSSVGASGAVSGVMFASVALFPQMRIGLFLLPLSIPSWLYALLYVGFSIYGIRSKKDNIGHDAHLGGALVGMALALIMHPAAFAENYGVILLITVPAVVFIYLIITRPQVLFVDNLFYKTQKDFYSVDHEWNARRADQQQEVDRILDKISRTGMGSLSRKEKQTLKDYSKKV
ncbi:MAG TPA: rhomboid family intramembrane serine protease [Puia sp.]|jgi:membrane associated rhomboid family serine protease|nr:rhomboid family intramembrane serine protease [Puia sp.]